MGVVPKGVWAFGLVVDEGMGWVPVLDFGFPSDGDVMDFECVVDDLAGVDVDGLWGDDFELEE